MVRSKSMNWLTIGLLLLSANNGIICWSQAPTSSPTDAAGNCIVTNKVDHVELNHLTGAGGVEFPGQTLRHCILKAYSPPFSVQTIRFNVPPDHSSDEATIYLEQPLLLGTNPASLPANFSLLIDALPTPSSAFANIKLQANNASVYAAFRISTASSDITSIVAGIVELRGITLSNFQYDADWTAGDTTSLAGGVVGHLTRTSDSLHLASCSIINCFPYGILMLGTVGNFTVINTTILSNRRSYEDGVGIFTTLPRSTIDLTIITGHGDGLYISLSATDTLVRNLRVGNTGGSGIVTEAARMMVYDSSIGFNEDGSAARTSRNGIYIYETANDSIIFNCEVGNSVDSNIFNHAPGSRISFSFVGISRNGISGTAGRDAIYIERTAENAIVEYCIIEHGDDGVDVKASGTIIAGCSIGVRNGGAISNSVQVRPNVNNFVMRDCDAGNSGATIVELSGSNGLVTNCSFGIAWDGTAALSAHSGIWILESTSNFTLQDTVIGNTYGEGILLSAPGTHLIDNIVGMDHFGLSAPTARDAVWIRATAFDTIISGINIGSSFAGGIVIAANNVLVDSASFVLNVEEHCVSILETAQNTTITSAFIGNCGEHGIEVQGQETLIESSYVGIARDASSIPVGIDGIHLSLSAENSRILSTHIGNSPRDGIAIFSSGSLIEDCVVGMISFASQVHPMGNIRHGIHIAESIVDTVITNNTIVFNFHGIYSEGVLPRLVNNVVGVFARGSEMLNGSNFKYGIFIDADLTVNQLFEDLNYSNAIDFNKYAGIRVGTVSSRNLLNNGWGIAACSLCICTNAPIITVDCSAVQDMGADFPVDVPAGTQRLLVFGCALTQIYWDELIDSGFTQTVEDLDFSVNPLLDPIPPSGYFDAQLFPNLRSLILRDTNLRALQNHTFAEVAPQLRILILAPALQVPEDDVFIKLPGSSPLLGALAWFDVARCPPGFYAVETSVPDGGICIRCPRGTFQPFSGAQLASTDTLIDVVCAPCESGDVDLDNDPATPCVLNPEVISLSQVLNDIRRDSEDISWNFSTVNNQTVLFMERRVWALGVTYSIAPLNLVANVGNNTEEHSFKLVPTPPGFFINTDSGKLLGVPEMPENKKKYNRTSSLFVAVSGYADYLLGEVHFEYQYHDLDPASGAVGPDSLPCVHGNPIDTNPDGVNEFDKTYQCDCSGTVYIGDNCQVALDASASDDTFFTTATSVISGAVLAGIILAIALSLVLKRRRTWKAVRRLTALANGSTRPEQAVLDDALFEVLTRNLDNLVPKLISLGADASETHPKTHLLSHSIILSRPIPDVDVLLSLFRAHCTIDNQIATQMKTYEKSVLVNEVLTQLAEENWRSDWSASTVLHRLVEACRKGSITPKVTTSLCESILTKNPELLMVEDKSGNTPGDYAMKLEDATDLERLLTVVVFGRYQLLRSAEPVYRSPTAMVLDCCDLSRPRFERSSRFAVNDDNNNRYVLKLMSDVASFRREIIIRSDLDECSQNIVGIVSAATSDIDMVSKLGNTRIITPGSPINVNQFHDDDVATVTCTDDNEDNNDDDDDDDEGIVVNTALLDESPPEPKFIHEVAATLMRKFPYALCFEKADKNLSEIISSERLAADHLSSIRIIASRLGSCISSLHKSGVVHGDIKPRNIVRVNYSSNQHNNIKLLDFDISFGPEKTAKGFPKKLASEIKIRQGNAYCSPELNVWSRISKGSNHWLGLVRNKLGKGKDIKTGSKIADDMESACQFDIWGFGATLYEVVTGVPLIQNSYDAATAAGEERLNRWQGLERAEEDQILKLHEGEDGVVALVDLLQWILGDVKDRPKTMDIILNHAFFAPQKGSMREHFVVGKLKSLLAKKSHSKRIYPSVFVSYSWANSTFVLDRLCLALAPICRGMWLDRLGGSHGMGEWTRESMESGVEGSDVVIAVVSPEYVSSSSCGFEMAIAAKYNKPIIPIKLGIPFELWPPNAIGKTNMSNQFRDPKTGDLRLFVDLDDLTQFDVKLEKELKPRLTATMIGSGLEAQRRMSSESSSTPTSPSPHTSVPLVGSHERGAQSMPVPPSTLPALRQSKSLLFLSNRGSKISPV